MIKAQGLWQNYSPPGPKAAGWLFSDAETSLIIGPVGSAKTSTGAQKCMRVALQQHPSIKDGVIRAQICAVRPNYRRMNDTLLRSVVDFFGKDGRWKKDDRGPSNFFLAWEEDGQRIEMEILFRAFGDQAIESFTRGFQPTAWWGNEFDELPNGAFSKMLSRAGRYMLQEQPDPDEVPPVKYSKIFGDCNMPDFDSWLHKQILNKHNPNVEVFLQPSGYSPEAENLQNLRKIHLNYYSNLADKYRAEGDEASIKRFIENKAGYTSQGKQVYPMFDAARHMQKNLVPDPLRQLILGVDQGSQAAVVIGQQTADRTARIFDEVVLEPGTFFGGEEFAKILFHKLQDNFKSWLKRGGLVLRLDPAAKQRHSGSREDDPRRWAFDFIEALEALLQPYGCGELDWDYAPTNVFLLRKKSVSKLLVHRGQSSEGLIIDAKCKRLLRGFSGGYRYSEVKGSPGHYNKSPLKDHFSDVHDAMQYFSLYLVPEVAAEYDSDRSEAAKFIARSLSQHSDTDFNDAPTEILM